VSNIAQSRGLTLVETGGFTTATTLLGVATSGVGAEGTPLELIASTIAAADHIVVFFYMASVGSVEEVSIDILIGPATEQVLIENIPFSGRVALGSTHDTMSFPIHIPAGTRISTRVQADSAVTMGIGVALYKGNGKSYGYTAAKGYGITAQYGGTAVDPGAVANTKNATPVELVASTGEQINGFWVHVGQNENLTVNASTGVFVDILVGANPNEKVIVSNHFVISNTNENAFPSVFYDIVIPAGSRISCQMQCSDTDATDRVRTVALVGLN
jgi:hypothetical protein